MLAPLLRALSGPKPNSGKSARTIVSPPYFVAALQLAYERADQSLAERLLSGCFGRNAHAIIFHAKHALSIARPERDTHRSSMIIGKRMFQRICHQLVDNQSNDDGGRLANGVGIGMCGDRDRFQSCDR